MLFVQGKKNSQPNKNQRKAKQNPRPINKVSGSLKQTDSKRFHSPRRRKASTFLQNHLSASEVLNTEPHYQSVSKEKQCIIPWVQLLKFTGKPHSSKENHSMFMPRRGMSALDTFRQLATRRCSVHSSSWGPVYTNFRGNMWHWVSPLTCTAVWGHNLQDPWCVYAPQPRRSPRPLVKDSYGASY